MHAIGRRERFAPRRRRSLRLDPQGVALRAARGGRIPRYASSARSGRGGDGRGVGRTLNDRAGARTRLTARADDPAPAISRRFGNEGSSSSSQLLPTEGHGERMEAIRILDLLSPFPNCGGDVYSTGRGAAPERGVGRRLVRALLVRVGEREAAGPRSGAGAEETCRPGRPRVPPRGEATGAR